MKHVISFFMLAAFLADNAYAGTQPVNSGTLIQATSISSNLTSFNADFTLSDVIDPNGLTATYVSEVTDFNSFVPGTQHTAPLDEWSSSSGQTSGYLTFDFGQMATIDAFAIWNSSWLNGGADSDVNQVQFFADSDGVFNNGTLGAATGILNVADSGSPSNHFAQIFAMTPVTAQFFHLSIASIDESQPPTGGIVRSGRSVALADVVFRGELNPVPVPAAVWLFVSGFIALMSFAIRNIRG